MNKIITDIKKNLGKASVNKKLYVFLVCLFLSTFYWLINVLGNTYTTELLVTVIYKNQPEKYVVLNELPSNLNLSVTTDGYTLLAYQLELKNPKVEINLEDYQFSEGNTKEIIVDDFREVISKQLAEKIEINEIFPKKINVVVDTKIIKQLKVLPLYKFSFAKQYQLSDSIIVTPNIVEVVGPKNTLDTINIIPTDFFELTNIEGSLKKRVKLNTDILSRYHLQIKTTDVEISIITDKFTEYKLNLPIGITNKPDSMEVVVVPQTIEVNFMTPLSKLSQINPDKFDVIVDCEELSSTYNKLKVHLIKHPLFLKSVTIKPANVEYILKRK
ncbi:MAG: hypothetical protein AB7O47_04970 [Flavobacteriales bacterium]